MKPTPTLKLTDRVRSIGHTDQAGCCAVTFAGDPGIYRIRPERSSAVKALQNSLAAKTTLQIEFDALSLEILAAESKE